MYQEKKNQKNRWLHELAFIPKIKTGFGLFDTQGLPLDTFN